jgi:hypothetical protein
MNSMAECGADLFDAPDGSSLVELTLFANECRSGAFENPDVVVGGCLPMMGAITPVKPPSSTWRT